MAVGDIIQLRTEVGYGQCRSINGLTFLSTSTDPTWDGRVADVWNDFMADFFAAFISPDATHDLFKIHHIIPATTTVEFHTVTPPRVGGLGTGLTAGQVAPKVTWYPDGSHRSQRGRTFIGGLAASEVVEARRVSEDAQTLMNAWAAEMMATWGEDGTESTARFAILSRQLDGAPRSPFVALPVIEYNVPSVLGTQRRRLL